MTSALLHDTEKTGDVRRNRDALEGISRCLTALRRREPGKNTSCDRAGPSLPLSRLCEDNRRDYEIPHGGSPVWMASKGGLLAGVPQRFCSLLARKLIGRSARICPSKCRNDLPIVAPGSQQQCRHDDQIEHALAPPMVVMMAAFALIFQRNVILPNTTWEDHV